MAELIDTFEQVEKSGKTSSSDKLFRGIPGYQGDDGDDMISGGISSDDLMPIHSNLMA